MKKGIKYGILGVIGCVCIGVGIGMGIKIGTSKTQPVVGNAKNVEQVIDEDSNQEIKEDSISNQVSITTPIEEDAYKKNKILAADLMAQYQKEQENQKIESESAYQQIKDEYEKDSNSYLLEMSDIDRLTTYEYMRLDTELAQIARNEIYARHGYMFHEPKYQAIFNQKSWYQPVTTNANEIDLSETERYNVMCLKWWEKVNHDFTFGVTGEGFTDCYQFDMNQTFTMDLNGDGIQEEISYKVITDVEGGIASGAIEVNGRVQESLEGNFASHIWVVDVDPEDNYKELVIYDQGPSSDPVDSYYYYDGEKLVLMGAVEGHLNEDDYIKDKVLHAVKRFDILGTQRYRWDYELTPEHTWREIPCHYKEVNIPIMAQNNINIYKAANTTAAKTQFKAGTSFTAIGTDLKEWIKVELKDGSEGWINVEEYPSYELGGLMFVD